MEKKEKDRVQNEKIERKRNNKTRGKCVGG